MSSGGVLHNPSFENSVPEGDLRLRVPHFRYKNEHFIACYATHMGEGEGISTLSILPKTIKKTFYARNE